MWRKGKNIEKNAYAIFFDESQIEFLAEYALVRDEKYTFNFIGLKQDESSLAYFSRLVYGMKYAAKQEKLKDISVYCHYVQNSSVSPKIQFAPS